MSNQPIGARRRHSRLHAALIDLSETRKVQMVPVPEDIEPVYYQKYAGMLAERWGMHVQTRLLYDQKQLTMLIGVKPRVKAAHV